MAIQTAHGRGSQNSEILYNFLLASISEEVLAKVNKVKDGFVLVINDEKINDGVFFLKSIIDKTYSNSLSSAEAARKNLSSLDSHFLRDPKSNITKLNEHVMKSIKELEAANESTTDLVMNLFKWYSKTKDKTFKLWLQRQKDN